MAERPGDFSLPATTIQKLVKDAVSCLLIDL